MSEKPISIAVIGTSMISNTFIESIEQTDLAQVAGVFSRHVEKVEAYKEAHPAYKVWPTIEDLAADETVDAVYIASPNAFHAVQATQLMDAGKHVLLEKPMAPTIGQVKELIPCAAKNNVVLQEAMLFYYDPAAAAVKEALAKIGTVRSASFAFGRKSSRYDELLAGKVTNVFCPRMAGGALMDIGVYPISAMVALFGEPADVDSFSVTVNNAELVEKAGGDPASCSIEGGAVPPIIDICGRALFTYEDKVVSCAWTKCTDGYSDKFGGATVEGEKGTLTWSRISEPKDAVIYYHNGGVEELKDNYHFTPAPASKASKGDVNNMKFEIDAFARRVIEAQKTGKVPSVPENKITEIVAGIIENIRLNSAVVFPCDLQSMDV